MNMPPGSTYLLTIRTEETITVSAPNEGGGSWTTGDSFEVLLRTIEAYDDGDLFVSVTVVKADIGFIGAPLGPFMKGKTFGMRLSPRGGIGSLSGTDALRDDVRSQLERRKAKANRERANEPIDDPLNTISDDSLRGMIGQVTAVWPAVPVSPGDTWEREPSYRFRSDTQLATKFKLESWDPALALVSFQSIATAAGKRSGYDLAETEQGEIHIAPVEGRIKSYRATGSTSGTVTNAKGTTVHLKRTYSIYAELVPR
jgi:hypothetical protein